MEKLPKEFKKKWIEALRSGNYKQCKGELHDKKNDSYCCLGVACRIVHPRKPLPTGHINASLNATKVPNVLHGYKLGSIPDTLAKMNDTGKSFKEISDYIEKNL